MRRALPVLAVLALAGCGGKAAAPPPKPKPVPRIPAALAHSWQTQARAVATSLAARDGCTAKRQATALRTSIVAAVNAHRVPARYQETLLSAVNDLPQRIGCTPPKIVDVVTPVHAKPAPHPHPKPHPKPPDHHRKHGDHG